MTDPYANAAIPQVQPPAPPQGDPYAAMPDPYANAAHPPATAATQQQDPSLLSQFWAARPHPVEEGKGFVKGAMQSAAGLLEMYSKVPGGIVPGVGPGTGAGTHQASEAINKHARINNTDQEQGQIPATIAALLALPAIEA